VQCVRAHISLSLFSRSGGLTLFGGGCSVLLCSIQQSAALALGRLANYNDELAEAVVSNEILPQLVRALLRSLVRSRNPIASAGRLTPYGGGTARRCTR
jgi:hypothetical protein